MPKIYPPLFLILFLIVTIGAALSAPRASGQDVEEPEEEVVNFNYAYSAVLGAGYYSTPSGRVIVGSLPLSWPLPPINERNTLRVLFPFTAGVADIFNDEGEIEIAAQLVTATFFPGIAWEHKAMDNWLLVPAAQAGFAKDFEADTNAWLYSISLRSYAWWNRGKHQFGLGNRLVGAGQTIEGSGSQTGFVLLESGLEWDHLVPWKLGDHLLSAGIYFMWQHYAHAANLEAFAEEEINLVNHYRVGFTFGYRDPVTFFRFIPLHRVGIAFGRGNTAAGNEIKSITLNLGFPLSYD